MYFVQSVIPDSIMRLVGEFNGLLCTCTTCVDEKIPDNTYTAIIMLATHCKHTCIFYPISFTSLHNASRYGSIAYL